MFDAYFIRYHLYFLPSFSLADGKLNFGADIPFSTLPTYLINTFVLWTSRVFVQQVWQMSNVMRSRGKGGWDRGGLVVARMTSCSLSATWRGVTLTVSVPFTTHYYTLCCCWVMSASVAIYVKCTVWVIQKTLLPQTIILHLSCGLLLYVRVSTEGTKLWPVESQLPHHLHTLTHSYWGNNVCGSLTVTSTQQPLSVRAELGG